jgi:hypothetical protein
MKLGAELRAELLHKNDGLAKDEGHPAHPTTAFEVQHAGLTLDGALSADDTVRFGFDLLHPGVSPLDYGFFTHTFAKIVGVSIGKMRVLQGGWDNASYEDYRAHATGFYADNLVYDLNEPMAAVSLHAAGVLTLQILNDKVAGTDAAASWNKTQHPTWVLGWQGEFGPITPLIDVGSYDNNHSRWVDAGVKTSMNGLEASLDLYNKNQVNRYTDAAGKGVGKADVSSGITLNVSYELKGAATPWFYFSTFNDKQASDIPLNLDDHEFNEANRFDDNGQVIAVGVNVDALAKGYTPYAAVVTRSAKFESQKHPGDAQDKSELWIRAGILASL